MSDTPVEGWWRAKDGRWYPPETHPDVASGPLVPPVGWVHHDDGTWGPADPGPIHDPDEPVTVSVVRVGRPHRRRGRVVGLCVLALAAVFAGAYALKGKANHNEPTVDVRDQTTIRTTTSTTTVEVTTELTTTTVTATTTSIDWAAVGALAAHAPSSTTTTAAPTSTRRRHSTTTTIDWAALAAAQAGHAPPATAPPATSPPATDPPTTTPPVTDTAPPTSAAP